jgi:hypothetical protein
MKKKEARLDGKMKKEKKKEELSFGYCMLACDAKRERGSILR